MVNPRILVVALIAALLPVLGIASPASAVNGSISVSAPDVVQSTWECPCAGTDVSFSVAAPTPEEFLYYTYEVVVTAPDGYRRTWKDDAYYGGQWQWHLGLAPSLDEYGVYAISATVKYYGFAGNVPIDTKTATSSFTFSGPPKPPAPPGSEGYSTQIPATASHPMWLKPTRYFSAIVQSEYRQPRYGETGIPAQVRLLVGSKVAASHSMTWSKTVTLSVTIPRKKRTKRHLVQIEINGQIVFARYCKVKGKRD